ncbi:MAG: bacteriophage holin [Legionellaceae bacterium]|nr:bacteriophage holin [Legionellaceae bacterium]
MITCRISPVALGIASGLLWGFSLLFMGLVAHYLFYGVTFVETMGTLYMGYGPTVLGSFLGGLFGFVDGFVRGFILAFIYNFFVKCFCNRSGACCSVEHPDNTKK